MIVSVSGVMSTLKEMDACTNPVPCMEEIDGKLVEGTDTCNCEMLCKTCADKLFMMLVWTRDEDKETVVSA